MEKSGVKEEEVRQFLKTEATQFIRKQVEIYLRELKEEFSKGLILPTDKTKPQEIKKNKTVVGVTINKKSFQDYIVSSLSP